MNDMLRVMDQAFDRIMKPADAPPVDRQRFLGGSDAAAVLSVSPWATPLDVYLEKTGQAVKEVDPARERLFKRGKRLEPVVIDMLVEDLDVKVTKRSTPARPNRYTDPEHPFLAAEIDFEWEVQAADVERWNLDPALIGTIQSGEVKTVHVFASAKFGEAETEEVPIEYAAQAMDGLMITGRKLTLFAVLVGADNLQVYFIRRDEETIAAMRQRLVKFWTDHVLAGVPPDPVNLPDVLKLFRKAPPIAVEASLEVAGLVEELERAKQAATAAEERQVELKFRIGEFMLGEAAIELERKRDGRPKAINPTALAKPGSHVLTYGGAELLLVNLQEQQRLDGERVKRDYPEVAAACIKPISFYRFDRPRKRK